MQIYAMQLSTVVPTITVSCKHTLQNQRQYSALCTHTHTHTHIRLIALWTLSGIIYVSR